MGARTGLDGRPAFALRIANRFSDVFVRVVCHYLIHSKSVSSLMILTHRSDEPLSSAQRLTERDMDNEERQAGLGATRIIEPTFFVHGPPA